MVNERCLSVQHNLAATYLQAWPRTKGAHFSYLSKMSSPKDLIATFSPSDCSHNSKTIDPVIGGSNHFGPTSIDSPKRASRGSSICLISALIGGCKKNCLLSYILGATLLASVLNTILLSYVIKSLQLNDRGFINGKIRWDETMGATVFELPTSLRPGKSISLNSIESPKDRPLKFLVNKPVRADKGRSSVFLSTMPTRTNDKKPSPPVGEADPELTDRVGATKPELILKSNYLAANELDAGRDMYRTSTLEIGTRALKLDLIDVNTPGRNIHSARNGTYNRRSQSPTSRLLEFDDESRSIILPLEAELRLISEQQTSSIALDDGLSSESIVGSLEQSLRVQTRKENLIVRCRDLLELVSKSASVKLTSLEEFSLSSASMSLSSGQGLYITKGIEYFDSELADETWPAGANNKPSTGPASRPEAKSNGEREPELFAHDLLVVDGILRAVAA